MILAAIFILQNSQEVTVDFLFTTTEAPLIFALLFAGDPGLHHRPRAAALPRLLATTSKPASRVLA